MIQRFTARLMLACYGVIALWGQGLHLWTDGGECCVASDGVAASCSKSATCSHSHHRGHVHHHHVHHHHADKKVTKPAAIQLAVAPRPISSHGSQSAIHSLPSGYSHDCERCAICQHQSLGQIFAMSPPLVSGPIACETIRPLSAESALCPALHSPAQPRAPPAV